VTDRPMGPSPQFPIADRAPPRPGKWTGIDCPLQRRWNRGLLSRPAASMAACGWRYLVPCPHHAPSFPVARNGLPRGGEQYLWCPGWELNPHSPCGKTDFKSVASADFATRAYWKTKALQSRMLHQSRYRERVRAYSSNGPEVCRNECSTNSRVASGGTAPRRNGYRSQVPFIE
jgi:hypothetical protein